MEMQQHDQALIEASQPEPMVVNSGPEQGMPLPHDEAAPQQPPPQQQQQQQQIDAQHQIPPQQLARTPEMPPAVPVPQADDGVNHTDAAMDVDDSSMTSTTITADSNPPLREFHPQQQHQPGFGAGFVSQEPTSYHHRPQSSYSDTTYSPRYSHHNTDSQQYGTRFMTSSDADTPPRHGGNQYYDQGRDGRDQAPRQSHSRPNSALGYRPRSESATGRDRYSDPNVQRNGQAQAPPQQQQEAAKNTSVVIKVGMVGDAQIGKTSLMVKYVEGSWDEDYIQTLGVNFMEKTISIRNTEITFSIWDLGGQREFVNMLPLVCNDAVAILFMFDLTRKSTLNSIKEWYRQGRGFNKTAIPFLVGTKYDHFVNFPREEQEEISNQAKRFAKAMKASLIFSSTSHSINVQKIFKIVLSKAFDLKCTIPEIENIGEPLLLYQSV